jgi:hypothetical protein
MKEPPPDWPRSIPAAVHVSVLIEAPGEGDAYFMCLLDAEGKPMVQFGWPLDGWKDFAARILSQVEDFELFNRNRAVPRQ